MGQYINENILVMLSDFERHLTTLATEDLESIHKRLQNTITSRIKGRFRSGAHSEHELGENYLLHYSMGAWEKLASGKWTWKPDLPLVKQLEIIAENLISKQVEKYRRQRDKQDIGEGTVTQYQDPDFFTNLSLTNDPLYEDEERNSEEELANISQAIQDDEDLVDLFTRLMQGETYPSIVKSNGWTNTKLYRLIEKFKRRMKAFRKKPSAGSS